MPCLPHALPTTRRQPKYGKHDRAADDDRNTRTQVAHLEAKAAESWAQAAAHAIANAADEVIHHPLSSGQAMLTAALGDPTAGMVENPPENPLHRIGA